VAEACDLFAVTAPGLEPLCARELAGLGVSDPRAVAGGVEWTGGMDTLLRSNLESRLASRVLVRVGGFRARTFAELERHTRRLPWQRFLPRGAAVRLRVTCRKSRLYHEGAVAERVLGVLAAELEVRGDVARGDDDEDAGATAQLVIVRFLRDVCTVSMDSSGALLHRRGYRQAVAKAPLRETLAAAMLAASGWRAGEPLHDPFCGSGTIPIEAALLARRIAPGLAGAARAPRAYAFEQWPDFPAAAWLAIVEEARARIRATAPGPLSAADRVAGAIRAARANAARAGVEQDVDFAVRGVADAGARPAGGWIVTNPPYGVRVGERQAVASLYEALGESARTSGARVALLAADPKLAARSGLGLSERLATRNGGIAVSLLLSNQHEP
jgi:putative N6-adenine-specific DNA methylase